MHKGVLTLLTLILTAPAVPAQQGWAEKMFKGKTTHDFGTVPRGAQLVHRFTLTNIYAVQMDIEKVTSGCGCVTAKPGKYSLKPRESTTVEVRMDAARFTGPKTVGVRISVGPEYVSSAELRITANSRADIVFNPGQVSFATVTRGQTPTKFIDVEYAGKLKWEVSEVTTSKEAPFTATVKEKYRRAGQVGYRVTVVLKANAPLGSLKENVFLKTNDPASPQVPILVEANIQSSLTVSPGSFNLGTVKVNTAFNRTVVVRGNRDFRITKVEGLDTEVELGAALALTDDKVQFLKLKIKPTKEGKFSRTLKIRTTLQDTPVVVTIDGTANK